MLIDNFISAKTYIKLHDEKHYCEAIIDGYGRIRDAIPSHQECLIRFYCLKHGINRNELFAGWHPEASPLHYIAESLNHAVLWYNYAILPLRFTSRQIATLRLLHGNNIIDLSPKSISISAEKSLMDLKYSDRYDDIDKLIEKKIARRDEAIERIWK